LYLIFQGGKHRTGKNTARIMFLPVRGYKFLALCCTDGKLQSRNVELEILHTVFAQKKYRPPPKPTKRLSVSDQCAGQQCFVARGSPMHQEPLQIIIAIPQADLFRFRFLRESGRHLGDIYAFFVYRHFHGITAILLLSPFLTSTWVEKNCDIPQGGGDWDCPKGRNGHEH